MLRRPLIIIFGLLLLLYVIVQGFLRIMTRNVSPHSNKNKRAQGVRSFLVIVVIVSIIAGIVPYVFSDLQLSGYDALRLVLGVFIGPGVIVGLYSLFHTKKVEDISLIK